MRPHLQTRKEPVPKESISPFPKAARWDETMLVSRALEGDSFAENAIYRQYAPYLLNLAARLTQRMTDADDVVQETFVIAFRKLQDLNDPKALKPWLIRILISQIKKSFRVRRLRAFFGMDHGKEDAVLSVLARDDADPNARTELKEIDAALQRTPPKWRTVWMLHRIEGMSIRETAQATACSIATVKRYVAAVDTAVQSKTRGLP